MPNKFEVNIRPNLDTSLSELICSSVKLAAALPLLDREASDDILAEERIRASIWASDVLGGNSLEFTLPGLSFRHGPHGQGQVEEQ